MDPRSDLPDIILSSAKAMTAASAMMVEITRGGVKDGSPVSRGQSAEELIDALHTALKCTSDANPHRINVLKAKIITAFTLASMLKPPAENGSPIRPLDGRTV